MMNKWFNEGINYEQFLELNTPENKEQGTIKRETMILSTETKEQIEALEEAHIVAFVEPDCLDGMVVLPYLEKIQELNPKVSYTIIPRKEEGITTTPTFVFYNKNEEQIDKMESYPEKFKKRLKGLDKEDTIELETRYRRGYYNNEIISGILSALSA
ncbi:MAG: thioredoxin family protein [Cellulosilyticaceae bacterium]